MKIKEPKQQQNQTNEHKFGINISNELTYI